MTAANTLYGRRQARQAGGRGADAPLVGGALCLDFVNTVDAHDGRPGEDRFGSGYVNLLDWFARAGVVSDDDTRRLALRASREPREAVAVRKRALALREALYRVVTALTRGEAPPEDDLAAINDEIAQARAHERLAPGEAGLAWQDVDRLALDAPLRAVARSAADLLSSPQAARIRQCAGPECQRVFLDTSRNGSRVYCSSTRCGSQVRVRRFRERQRQEARP